MLLLLLLVVVVVEVVVVCARILEPSDLRGGLDARGLQDLLQDAGVALLHDAGNLLGVALLQGLARGRCRNVAWQSPPEPVCETKSCQHVLFVRELSQDRYHK